MSGLAVLFPPRVSLRDGTVEIDVPAALAALHRLPAQVRAVACSPDSQTSPQEESTLEAMATLLGDGAAAVVAARRVSEAVKVVEDGWVTAGLDRSTLASPTLPILVERRVMADLLSGAAGSRVSPVRQIIAAGGTVRVASLSG